jgi:bifunctional DNase/RNase
MVELSLVGVRVELPSNQPIVLLKETQGERYLPIWIGAVEATAIAFALQGIQTLIRMSLNGKSAEVSSRPSDAIALAVRINAPIFAAEEVLEQAGIELKDDEETEVEKFREFLDQVTPDDFAAGQ